MTTVLLSGVGNLGGWALEFLARAPGVDRIVTLKRGEWTGASRAGLARIGSVFQGHTKQFEHHRLDLADVEEVARLIGETEPAAILHSATMGSPRRLLRNDLDPGVREALEAATFGMWLPWHLLPAARLMEAVAKSGVETRVVNASFPDVVNVSLAKALVQGPTAGAGNGEVVAAQVLRHVVDATGAGIGEVEVSLVGSHALLTKGPAAGVPYHLHVMVGGRDLTAQYPLTSIVDAEPIDWRRVEEFSIFAASAVKNLLALVGDDPVATHVTSPLGLPGGYPAVIGPDGVQLRLPSGLGTDDAVAMNEAAARWDGVEHIADDGTVTYTAEAAGAMTTLGYSVDSVSLDELASLSEQLTSLVDRFNRKDN